MTRDRISALFFLAVSIAYGLLATDIRVPPFAAQGVTARTLPYVLAGTGAFIAILMLVLPPKDRSAASGSGGLFAEWGDYAWAKVILLGLDMLVYGYLLTRIGFITSTSLFLIAGFLILGERRIQILLLASVPVVVVFWFILNQLLGIFLGDLFGSWGAALFAGGENG